MKFETFFTERGVGAEVAARMSGVLEEHCPWLDLEHEVAEDIGIELIDRAAGSLWDALLTVEEFVDWYNDQVRARRVPQEEPLDPPYGDLCEVVGRLGKMDASGEGGYWVVPDSFARLQPSIVSFGPLRRAEELRAALLQWKTRHPQFSLVSVVSREGEALLRV
jgi:hypothetical protein